MLAIVQPPANPLSPNLGELVIGAVVFLIVFAVLARVLIPRITKTLAEREEAIEGGMQHADDVRAEAARVLEEYRSELAEARHAAAQVREEAREQGAQIIAQIREEATTEARRILDEAHAEIEAERERALASLRGELSDISVELASRVVGEPLDEVARQRGVVDRFLAELETRTDEGSRLRTR